MDGSGEAWVPEETVRLIRSFHEGMRATIRLDGTALEEISVKNGLRQGCCMAPVLFNLYTCLALERWLARVEGAEGVGIDVRYKYDKKLFRRYTRNANERKSRSAYLLMMGLSLHQQDQVQRGQCWSTNKPAVTSA